MSRIFLVLLLPLMLVKIDTRQHINNAKYEDLIKLEFIKHERAKSIIENKPYTDKQDLIDRTKLGEVTFRLISKKYKI